MLSALLTSAILALPLVSALPNQARTTTPPTIPPQVGCKGKLFYYNGCYDELKSGLHALNHQVTVKGPFTVTSCAEACAAAGYSIAAPMNGNTCMCDNAISVNAPKLNDSECNTVCTGDSKLACGGTWHLQVYYTKKGPLPNPKAPQSVGSGKGKYNYQGCWSSKHEDRALQGHYIGEDTMTPASCASQCYALGFKYAGTHYGRECFCGQNLINSVLLSPNECAQACAGDSTQQCGSYNSVNLYVAQNPPAVIGAQPNAGAYVNVGCFVDTVNPRVLDQFSFTDSKMTADKCAQTCLSKKLPLAGVENGTECYCGSKLPTDMEDNSACNTLCGGNSKYTCGGGGRIQVYKNPSL